MYPIKSKSEVKFCEQALTLEHTTNISSFICKYCQYAEGLNRSSLIQDFEKRAKVFRATKQILGGVKLILQINVFGYQLGYVNYFTEKMVWKSK